MRLLICLLTITLIVPAGIINDGVFAASVGAHKYTVPAGKEKNYKNLQGGGTDGTYAYFVSVDSSKSKEKCMLSKAKIQSGKWKFVKKISDTGDSFNGKKNKISLNHGNDITYNSTTNELVIISKREVNPKTDPEVSSVTIVNPSTLKCKKQIPLSYKIYCISYNKDTNQYIAGISGTTDFYTLNSDFTINQLHKGQSLGKYLKQGVDSDGQYIYFVQTKKVGNKYNNKLVVYTRNGRYIKTVKVGHGKEAEHLFHVGNTYYMGFNYKNGKSRVYKVNLKLYKVQYNGNGGTGQMGNTYVEYGHSTTLKNNKFKKKKYKFSGWTVSKEDGKWLYKKGDKKGWYTPNTKPDGYKKKVYKNKAKVSKVINRHGAVITLHAKWTKKKS